MKSLPLAPLLLASLLFAPTAGADDARAQCAATYADAQVMKKATRLVEAREKLVVCAQEACPSFIKSDCAQWLSEVESRLPQVVLEAHDRAGRDVTDVSVEVDGKPLVTGLTGKAAPIDPGPHTFRFRTAGAPDVETKAVIAEGDKSRVVAVTFEMGAPATEPVVSPPPEKVGKAGSPVPAIVVGAVGVVALGASAGFFFSGKSDINHMKSTCAPFCAQSDIDAVHTKGIVSDVALAVGVVALGVATWLFFSRGESTETASRPGVIAF